ncbi:MAG: glycosyltransferase family 4 protein [Bacteroidota bacterium]
MPTPKNSKKKLIIMLCPYPQRGAPSQRFRYEQYLPALENKGYDYSIYSFLDEKTNRILYQPGYILQKIWGILTGYFRRVYHVFRSYRADVVLIHREATPLGPPWVEWLIGKILNRRIIYDFDDAIWLADQSGVNSWVSKLKWHSKVKSVCQWSYRVSVGNNYLANFARKHNPSTIINPTTIDTENHHNILTNHQHRPVTIGWTGSHSTLKYLSSIEKVLIRLSESYDFKFLIIADRPPTLNIKNLEFIRWSQATEIQDLARIQIGIMPLTDTSWSRGKCGFKALQYLSLGIPAVVSPVGVNAEIVQANKQGFHATTELEWYASLEKLLTDAVLREKMGRAGRQRVIDHYSVTSNTSNFLQLLP